MSTPGQGRTNLEQQWSLVLMVQTQNEPHPSVRAKVPPTKPQVICRSNTYPKGFYCSWHLQPPPVIQTEFEVMVEHNQRVLEVERDPVHKNRCHVKFPELFSAIPYRVNVTAINSLGSAHTVTSFEEITIVKPDPPEKVEVKPIPNKVQRLEVTWNHPSTWPDVENFPLKYFLRYRPLIRDDWQHQAFSAEMHRDEGGMGFGRVGSGSGSGSVALEEAIHPGEALWRRRSFMSPLLLHPAESA
ncbi:hypothetical protein ACEWY4_004308 [Coilia grayii]|uniref:Fibronectin type-III domain-containing protein n=1 Tax=Coilia grayii TaxID=363190 RepID=A0ABD1KL57_9TELE